MYSFSFNFTKLINVSFGFFILSTFDQQMVAKLRLRNSDYSPMIAFLKNEEKALNFVVIFSMLLQCTQINPDGR